MSNSQSKRVALYARVSTESQTTDNQLVELRAVAERMGWVVVGEFIDHAISGAKGRDQRPAFDKLQKGAVRKEFDMVAAWSVDRLGRSLQHLVEFLSEIHESGVDLYLHQQGINTGTPAGKALFQMCGVFAEFEKSMIKERVIAGIARSKVTGTKSGKPHGRPANLANPEPQIKALRAEGKGMLKIAKELGVGVSTVQRVLKAA
ncbi:recombinase family protein [Methylotenera sp. 1P/1]|uniref:recombinase family protein n=1 Tax=Methylotenera sp. 1P/1 TaxID=1131551 RepID=UPI00036F4977|nr:recombinase family protein [Methylotenera sp. 1P/1]